MAEFISGLNKVLGRYSRLARDAQNLEKPVEKGGKVMLQSIRRNFAVGGRPKWTPLAASTKKRKKGRKILVGEGTLRDSFKPSQNGNSVEVGTNVIYGPRHNFGYEGKEGRGHSPTPARPFVLFQQEDVRSIGNVLKQHIANGAVK